jgi:hypothetical protein
MPWDGDIDKKPEELALEEAANFTALAPETGAWDRKCTSKESIKKALALNIPVVIAIQIEKQFEEHHGRKDYRWNGGKAGGVHAMLIVGYDDARGDGPPAFHVLNSWGTHFGDNGYVWVPYDQFEHIDQDHWCMEAHCIKVADNTLPQGRKTVAPERTYSLESDQAIIQLLPEKKKLPGAPVARAITTTDSWLYALTQEGAVWAYQRKKVSGEMIWNEVLPKGTQVSMIAATTENLFALKDGQLSQRISGDPPRWERTGPPETANFIDLRDRGGTVAATTDDGRVYRWDSKAKEWRRYPPK